jgi:hypothetical protein
MVTTTPRLSLVPFRTSRGGASDRCRHLRQRLLSSYSHPRPVMPRVMPRPRVPHTLAGRQRSTLPPMPRVQPKTTPARSPETLVIPPTTTTSTASDSGSWLIRIGWTLLGLVVVDRCLQYQQREDEYRRMIASIMEESEKKRAELLATYQHHATRFECIVRIPYRLGGSHGLEEPVQVWVQISTTIFAGHGMRKAKFAPLVGTRFDTWKKWSANQKS